MSGQSPAGASKPPYDVEILVEKFSDQSADYTAAAYKEASLRAEFVNPFFKALGWDVTNESRKSEKWKEVIHEFSLEDGKTKTKKSPDYCFRYGGVPQFFVEAKKPSVHVHDDHAAALQLRWYLWNAKLPLGILTNFKELAVYDGRRKPNPADRAPVGRLLYLQYEEYEPKWSVIADIFSKEAVERGSFDKFADASKDKKGSTPVDEAFLQDIERWRDALARNIANRNKALTQRETNFSVQRTIDRLVFLKICEDRGIEPDGLLESAAKAAPIYPRLLEQFKRADLRYNSGLFHFEDEQDRTETPDTLTPRIEVDDKPLKDIINELYTSGYDFRVMPAAILGQVYEQFLGKVIRLTETHRAVVEEKPEVKKAGGVFYTPTYIVKRIVERTLGPRLQGKSPEQVANLRVLDPACGSGTFLIEAYQFLLEWHLEWYARNAPTIHLKEERIYQSDQGWRLTIGERRRILTNSIFGVDIDAQAVEVTKLSLLLKVLEGQTEQTLELDRKAKNSSRGARKPPRGRKSGHAKARSEALFHQSRALPDLGDNVKCGNTLIEPGGHVAIQSMLDSEELYRINAFDWRAEFPEVFNSENPGFDVVIGNPPYIRIQVLKEFAPREVELYKDIYATAAEGNYDIYVAFVERGLQLLNRHGSLGYILPHKFFTAKYGAPLRALLSAGKHVEGITHFGDRQVFDTATTYTCLLFLARQPQEAFAFEGVADLQAWEKRTVSTSIDLPTARLTPTEWNINVGATAGIVDKLDAIAQKLGGDNGLAHLFVGLQTDADDVFILERVREEHDRVLCASKATGKEHWFETIHLKPFLKGSLNIRRYELSDVTKLLIFPYETVDGKSVLIQASDYAKRFPLTWAYLDENRDRLSERAKGVLGKAWYGYVYKKNHTMFGLPKILVPSIATGSCFAPDLEGRYFFVGSGGGGGGGYGIHIEKEIDPYYVLGVLNSALISYFLRATSTPFRGGYIALNRQYIERIPIVTPTPSNLPATKEIARLARLIVDLRVRLGVAGSDQERTVLRREMASADATINKKVAALYGLSHDEGTIVEKAG